MPFLNGTPVRLPLRSAPLMVDAGMGRTVAVQFTADHGTPVRAAIHERIQAALFVVTTIGVSPIKVDLKSPGWPLPLRAQHNSRWGRGRVCPAPGCKCQDHKRPDTAPAHRLLSARKKWFHCWRTEIVLQRFNVLAERGKDQTVIRGDAEFMQRMFGPIKILAIASDATNAFLERHPGQIACL